MNKNYDFSKIYADADAIQMTPKVVIGVVRYAYKNTYNFLTKTSISLNDFNGAPPQDPDDSALASSTGPNASIVTDTEITHSNNEIESLAVVDYTDIFQIQYLCNNLSINSSKSSHNTSMTAGFIDPENVLMGKLTPGDWIFVCVVNNADDYAQLIKNIKAKQAINDAKLGLKFLGKIHSVVKNIQVSSEGMKRRGVSLQAFGFKEFDSTIFYSPDFLSLPDIKSASLVFGLSGALDNLKTTDDPQLLKTVNWVPATMRAFLGDGPPGTELKQSQEQGVMPKGLNGAYLVPHTIAKLLDFPITSASMTYSNILYSIIGIQQYGDDYMPNIADKVKYTNGQDLLCTKLMENTHFDSVSPWNNVPIWNIINSYTNSRNRGTVHLSKNYYY